MRIESNAQNVMQRLKMAERAILRANVKSVRGVTLAGQRFARRIAPVDSGELKAGIIRRAVMRKGKQVSSALISKVNKPFPYQKWVNEDIKTVGLPTTPNFKSGPRKQMRYRQTRHTGVPGYFNVTQKYMSKIFPKMVKVELNKELKIIYK